MEELRKILRLALVFICLAGLAFSVFRLWSIHSEYAEGVKVYDELAKQYVTVQTKTRDEGTKAEENMPANEEEEEEHVPVTVDFDALLKECKDVVGWIYCEGTPINYPIVRSRDNEYYLHRLMDGSYKSNGTLFMDYRNAADFSDWNSIVYGHNMKNNSMFGVLTDYTKQSFYEEHPVMWLLTKDGNYKIRLFAGYVTSASSDIYGFPQTKESRDALVDFSLSHSTFKADVDVQGEDRIITLSTCTYEYDDARYVLHGVLNTFK